MTTEEYGTREMERDFGIVTFGTVLESHRKCEELTMKAFATQLGISPQNFCDIEKGRRIPSPRRAAKIARLIGESESYWIKLAFQDVLRQEDLDYTISVA